MTENYWVIIPAKDEEKRIVGVIEKIKRHTNNIIVVDDGSTDNTYGVSEVSHKIQENKNHGKAYALLSGTNLALAGNANILIFIDGDGQHDPDKIPEFVAKINEGFDIVHGCRDLTNTKLNRKIGTILIKFFLRILWGINNPDPLSGYKAMTVQAFEKIKWNPAGRYNVESDILINSKKANLKNTEIEISLQYSPKNNGLSNKQGLGILWNVIKRRWTG